MRRGGILARREYVEPAMSKGKGRKEKELNDFGLPLVLGSC
jgi:hypothetical protein